jgi:hypothetical protein
MEIVRKKEEILGDLSEGLVLVDIDVVRLCCGKANCPTIKKVEGGGIEVTDDDGNTIKITQEQALLIPEAIEAMSEVKVKGED